MNNETGMERRTLQVKEAPGEGRDRVAAVVGVAVALGASAELVAVAGIAAGMLPAVVTALVANGGLSGVARALWRGR